MPITKPFRAIRPASNLVHLIVSRSYISYDDDALSEKLASNPYSFIHVINPDHGEDNAAPQGSVSLFERVRDKYMEFYRQGYFVQDEVPSYYIYRQRCEGKDFTGIICATASSDYANGRIKRHELTLSKREKMFTNYLQTTGINAEPVLLSYPDDAAVNEVIAGKMLKRPLYDFTTSDQMRHSLWAIQKPKQVAKLKAAFEAMDAFYIADGHHRTASSARLTAQENGGGYGADAPHDCFMSYLVPSSQMHIEAFHRLVKLDTPVDKASVLQGLASQFDITEGAGEKRPSRKGEFCINIKGDWFTLRAKTIDPDKLDVQLCSEAILEPVFGITDLRTDKRMRFMNGARGIGPLGDEVLSKRADIAIALYPVQMEELFAVSDRGETMPPKSTWVEPKLRSALTIYSLRKH
jgi:uncharacterized protein (DUF1015 family)